MTLDELIAKLERDLADARRVRELYGPQATFEPPQERDWLPRLTEEELARVRVGQHWRTPAGRELVIVELTKHYNGEGQGWMAHTHYPATGRRNIVMVHCLLRNGYRLIETVHAQSPPVVEEAAAIIAAAPDAEPATESVGDLAPDLRRPFDPFDLRLRHKSETYLRGTPSALSPKVMRTGPRKAKEVVKERVEGGVRDANGKAVRF